MPDLKPWFEVVTPHEDIREGRLSESIFAANLWAVVSGTAPDVYLDAKAFFEKTYLTKGLQNVLGKIARALSGKADTGDRILSLQTAFGGGKTHTLLALYHAVKNPQVAAQFLPFELPEKPIRVAVFTNHTCDVKQGRNTPEGIHTNTMWGEIALQLGGVELYKRVEPNDKAKSVPQGIFVDVLRAASPCLILLDEIADYCGVGALTERVGDSTLADQTISFIQQLTEAIQQVNGVALVATLPASHLEVANSERGQEILERLEKRFGRMGADVNPVSDDEIYEVVRRRLFEPYDSSNEPERVADTYWRMYQQHQSDVPADATKSAYKERILRAYPFHPELIDAFHLRWGSHNDFQRTRGVLRLLANIIGDLWQQRKTETTSQPLIQPCHVRWSIDALHAALTRLWGAGYDAVVPADIVGEKANAMVMDEERGGEYFEEKIAQGIAATILLGSFGGQAERAGYSTRDIRLSVSRPEVNWGYIDGALLSLEERAFYLHTASAGDTGKRYWFGTKPTLTKLIVQYRAQFAGENFDEEIKELIRDQVKSSKVGSAIAPSFRAGQVMVSPGVDLPEQKSLTLLVMTTDCAYSENDEMSSAVKQRVMEMSQKCGQKERHYRNTLLFLIPSARALSLLRQSLREQMALKEVLRDYGSQLDKEQKDELKLRLEKAEQDVQEKFALVYTYISRVDGQEVVISPIPELKKTFAEQLQSAWEYIIEEEWVLQKVGTVTLQRSGLIPSEGGTRVNDAIETFLRYTDKLMITSPQAVIQGLSQACKDRQIGLGVGTNPSNLQQKWCGEIMPLVSDEEGMWIIPPFEPEPTEPTPPPGPGPTPPIIGPKPPVEPKPPGEETEDGDKIRRIKITGTIPVESWSDVFRSFVNPVARMNLQKLKLSIDFDLELDHPLSEDDPEYKRLKESAQMLGINIETEK